MKLKTSLFCLCLAAALLLSGCGQLQRLGSTSAESETEAPTTQADTSTPPETAPETTPEPATETPAPETTQETVAESEFPVSVQSGQAFLYDLTNDRMAAIKGEGERLYPASITKLLTILTALQYIDPAALVTPGDEESLVADDSSVAYVRSNHTLSAEMLIEGMLLPSGNDAAFALSAAAGRIIAGDDTLSGVDAVTAFVEEMNRYGASLGMTGSHFVTPDGYFNEDHYSTVEDMALVSVLCAKNELVRRYCGLATADVVYASGHTNHWINTNLMLDPDSRWYNPYVTGLKTGSVDGSYSLVCILEKDGASYVAGVFSGENANVRYEDMTTIAAYLGME